MTCYFCWAKLFNSRKKPKNKETLDTFLELFLFVSDFIIFYHAYLFPLTGEDGAQNILRTGTIQATLKHMTWGDTAYGNGVYLTTVHALIRGKGRRLCQEPEQDC